MRKKKNTRDFKKIVLTGGHAATTALATAEELMRRINQGEAWKIYWLGSGQALEGKSVPTLESRVLPKIGVTTYSLIAGRFQRKLTIWSLPSFFKIPIGFVQAFVILLKIRPNVILSFGGFAAFPVVIAGWLLAIPVIIHEQTMVAGLANRLSSFFTRKVALAREESKKFFPAEKCVITGNPILAQIREVVPKESLGCPPTILLMGGSRGAQRINSLVDSILEKLLAKWRLLHITGPLDFEKFAERRKKFEAKLKRNYRVYSLLDPTQIDALYQEADLIIGRAGANTVAEIVATKRPAILIPIPWSYLDEQTENAFFAQKFGVASVLVEEGLTGDILLAKIREAFVRWGETVRQVKAKASPDLPAARKLVDLLEKELG